MDKMIDTKKIEKIHFAGNVIRSISRFHKIPYKIMAKDMNIAYNTLKQYVIETRQISNYRKIQLIERYIKPLPQTIKCTDKNQKIAMEYIHNRFRLTMSDIDIFIYQNTIVDPPSYFYVLLSYNLLNKNAIKPLDQYGIIIFELQKKIHNDFTDTEITFSDTDGTTVKKTIWFTTDRYNYLKNSAQNNNIAQWWINAQWYLYSEDYRNSGLKTELDMLQFNDKNEYAVDIKKIHHE